MRFWRTAFVQVINGMLFSIHKFESRDRRNNPDWNKREKQCTGSDSYSDRGARNARNNRFEHCAPERDSPRRSPSDGRTNDSAEQTERYHVPHVVRDRRRWGSRNDLSQDRERRSLDAPDFPRLTMGFGG